MSSTYSSASPGLDRKSLKKPDGFLAAISRFFSQIAQHTNVFIIVIAVLIGVGIIAGYWMNHLESKSDDARNALFLAEKAIETETKALAALEKPAVPADPKKKAATPESPDPSALEAISYKKLDVDQKFPDAVKKLKAVDDQFSGTRAAHEARLKLATLYYDHGEFAKALPWYEKAAGSAPGNFEKALALSSVGYTYENLAKPNEAIHSYQKALNLGEGGLKGELLLGMARSYEALHDTAKARSTYDRIVTELPNTEHSKTAELYRGWLQ
jgi:tetratricopeptide (TPR) repeat protein